MDNIECRDYAGINMSCITIVAGDSLCIDGPLNNCKQIYIGNKVCRDINFKCTLIEYSDGFCIYESQQRNFSCK